MSVLIPDPPSANDLYNTGKTEATIKRPELTILPGDLSDMILAAGAAQGDMVGTYAQDRFAATYLDGASGNDLDTLVDDHLGLQRFPSNASTGSLYFKRLATGDAGTISAGFQVGTVPDFNGISYTFTTDTDLTFGPSTLDGYVNATAVLAGNGSNVAGGTITREISAIFDTSISVVNPEYFAGGVDAETDENYRNRARNYYATLRRGTLAALAYGAEQVNGVFTVNVVEEIDPMGALDYQGNPAKTGVVNIYVADQDGHSSETMVNNVIVEEELYRAAGSIVNVYGAEFLDLLTVLGAPLEVVVTLRSSSGLTAASIQDNVKAAVVAKVNRLSPGDNLTADILKQVTLNVDNDNITAVALKYTIGLTTYNFSDILVESNQVIRTTTAQIVVSQA